MAIRRLRRPVVDRVLQLGRVHLGLGRGRALPVRARLGAGLDRVRARRGEGQHERSEERDAEEPHAQDNVRRPGFFQAELLVGGLEQLDRVARGILEQDLLAARPGDDVVAETSDRPPSAARPRPRCPRRSRWMRFHPPGSGVRPSGIGRPAELFGPLSNRRRLPRDDIGKRRRGVREHREPEVGGVERDGVFDVVDHVADAYEVVSHVRSGYSPSCLPRISLMISSVPPPIGPRRVSRAARSISYSFM